MVAGQEARALVETARMYQPQFSHSHKTDGVRGWLILTDLSLQTPFAQRTRIFGPLWSVDQPQSSLSFMSGVRFTAADVAAGKAKPQCGFDDRSRLIRQVRDAAGALIVEWLDVAADPPVWRLDAAAAEVGNVGEDWIEGCLRNTLGRTLVQEEADGQTRVYDQFTGKPKEDPWLAAAFGDYRKRPDCGNSRAFLTDDLSALVVNPQDRHNKDGRMIERFSLAGKEYSRAEYGLIYRRPCAEPAAFRKPPGEGFMGPPFGACVVGGEVLVLDIRDNALALSTVGGPAKFSWDRHDDPHWHGLPFPDIQFDATGERVLIRGLEDPAEQWRDGYESLVVWEYRAGRATRVSLPFPELFQTKDNEYIVEHARGIGTAP